MTVLSRTLPFSHLARKSHKLILDTFSQELSSQLDIVRVVSPAEEGDAPRPTRCSMSDHSMRIPKDNSVVNFLWKLNNVER
ncbi:hypothetical protein DPMN_172140 [Dreissena polymorpha]|uniref:Uncharacterized protein n=1 Tax=Dreissena polymorpha TaxID=45954 RepID=A0A9D4E0F7_DREPO|nr:hypothetical protein DPMN_172140 [Dreissena polymorpha]